MKKLILLAICAMAVMAGCKNKGMAPAGEQQDSTTVDVDSTAGIEEGKAFLEKFYKEGEKHWFEDDSIRPYLSKNAQKYLQGAYPYDGDGTELATWLFYQEGGWDLGPTIDVTVEPLGKDTYRVTVRSKFNKDVCSYTVEYGLAKIDGKWFIDKMKPGKCTLASDDADNADLLALKPDLSSDEPLILSGINDHKEIAFPYWTEDDLQEYNGNIVYDINLGSHGYPFQHLRRYLPGRPVDMKEAGRQILVDVNFDGISDLLICLGRHGSSKTLYYDAWLWNTEEGQFDYDGHFRTIPNPAIDKKNQIIIENAK